MILIDQLVSLSVALSGTEHHAAVVAIEAEVIQLVTALGASEREKETLKGQLERVQMYLNRERG